jgi:hypothetical protein
MRNALSWDPTLGEGLAGISFEGARLQPRRQIEQMGHDTAEAVPIQSHQTRFRNLDAL